MAKWAILYKEKEKSLLNTNIENILLEYKYNDEEYTNFFLRNEEGVNPVNIIIELGNICDEYIEQIDTIEYLKIVRLTDIFEMKEEFKKYA